MRKLINFFALFKNMSNLENITTGIKPEPSPEQYKTIIGLRNELHKKVAAIDAALDTSSGSKIISLNEVQEGKIKLVDRYNNLISPEPEDIAPVKIFETSEPLPMPSNQAIVDRYGNPFSPDKNPPAQPVGHHSNETTSLQGKIDAIDAQLREKETTLEAMISRGQKPDPIIEQEFNDLETEKKNLLGQNKTSEVIPEVTKAPEVPPISTKEKVVPLQKDSQPIEVPVPREATPTDQLEVPKESIKSPEKTKERVSKTLEKMKKKEGMTWWYYAGTFFAGPTLIGNWIGNKLSNKLSSAIDLLKEKFKNKTDKEKPLSLKEKLGDKKSKDTASPKTAPKLTKEELVVKEQKEKEVKVRTTEFLEKAFDGKLEGDNKAGWEKLKKVPIWKFFDPTKAGWILENYTPWQRSIYDKLYPLYRKEYIAAKDTQKLGSTSLEDYLTKLAEQDKLKDLWTKPLNNNS